MLVLSLTTQTQENLPTATALHSGPNRSPYMCRHPSVSSRLDDSRIDKLHDLRPNVWVLHVVLQRAGVLLCGLQDRLHDGVTHDLRHLGVAHRAGHRFLLGLRRALRVQRLFAFPRLLLDLRGVLPILVVVGRLLDRRDGFRVLTHGAQYRALANVRFHELRIHLYRLLRVLQRLGQCSKLLVAQRPVVVPSRVLRITLDALGVGLHGSREVARLEERIPLLPRLLAQRGVNIRRCLGRGFLPLRVAKLVEDIRGSVLSERLFEEFDCVREVAFLVIGGADASESLCNELEVGTEMAPLFDCFLGRLDALVVLALLEVDRCSLRSDQLQSTVNKDRFTAQVRQECGIFWP